MEMETKQILRIVLSSPNDVKAERRVMESVIEELNHGVAADRNLRLELSRMFSEEIDFCLEARYTEIFRRDARKNRYVSAPRVFFELSNYDVLVTEFVSGMFLSEILTAIETFHPVKTVNDLLEEAHQGPSV